jgi:site-specific recombinase XerD
MELKVVCIVDWLDGRKVGPSTKRKYLASLSSFCTYLQKKSILLSNPVRRVEAPAAAPPRMRYLEMPELQRLLAELPEAHRALSALMHGTGM